MTAATATLRGKKQKQKLSSDENAFKKIFNCNGSNDSNDSKNSNGSNDSNNINRRIFDWRC